MKINGKLEKRNYPKNKQHIIQQAKFKPPNCPSCKQNNWLEVDKGYYCQNCEYIINKQKHQTDKKVLRQDRDFTTRLNYANKNIKEIYYAMAITNYNSTEEMINKLQELKGKTKLKFYKNKSNYYNNMDIRMDEDPFAEKAQGISKIYHEVLLLLKFPQTKPPVRNMNNNYYDLYYTVIKNRDDRGIVNDKNENDYFKFNDIIPNHYVGNKPRETTLKYRKMRSQINHFNKLFLYE